MRRPARDTRHATRGTRCPAPGPRHAAPRGSCCDDAQFIVDGAEDHELLWYGVQEIPGLVD
ncbi:hypothetical protein EBF04_10515 [Streptomyces sp. I6]|nr:hypothetical protein EBF04_10515 [Streptomyces sp. I6]